MKATSPPRPRMLRGGGPSPTMAQWDHAQNYEPRIRTSVTVTRQTPIVVSRSVDPMWTEDGQYLQRDLIAYSDGSTEIIYTDIEGNPMSESPRFTSAQPQRLVEKNKMFDTITYTGEIVEFMRMTPISIAPDGTRTFGPYEDRTADLTSTYSVRGHDADLPVLIMIKKDLIDCTGSDPVSVSSLPFGHYAEIYVEDANIRWTQDGTAPAAGNGEQEPAGGTIKLYGKQAVDGFRALPADVVGDLDPTETARLTVTIWNMNPEGAARYATPDFTWALMADTDPSTGVVTQFWRRTYADGTTEDFQLDRITEYLVAGVAGTDPLLVTLRGPEYTFADAGPVSTAWSTGGGAGIPTYPSNTNINFVEIVVEANNKPTSSTIIYRLDGSEPQNGDAVAAIGDTLVLTQAEAIGFQYKVGVGSSITSNDTYGAKMRVTHYNIDPR